MTAMLHPRAPIGPRQVIERPLRLFLSGEPWAALLFFATSFVLGLCWLVGLFSLLLIGTVLSLTLVGIPLLALTMVLWVQGARLERGRVAVLLGVRIDDPYAPLPAGSLTRHVISRLRDRYVWQDLLYLLLLFPITIAECIIAGVALLTTLMLLATLPANILVNSPVRENLAYLPVMVVAFCLGVAALMGLPYLLVGLGHGHAWFARLLLGSSRGAALAARVDHLTQSRSRAIDASLAELRRIERDLHDGAQPRLVKLAMDLGRAREKMTADPEGARALVDEAHEEVKRVMQEIRDLARGIHPAVLTDRGLDAALSALAGRMALPVSVDVALDRRLPDAVELTAYFVVSEALTNVARHSDATGAHVSVQAVGDRLLLDVMDNGVGGADPARGTGLTGLAGRVAALDGVMTVDSPRDGGTLLHVEVPCGS